MKPQKHSQLILSPMKLILLVALEIRQLAAKNSKVGQRIARDKLEAYYLITIVVPLSLW